MARALHNQLRKMFLQGSLDKPDWHHIKPVANGNISFINVLGDYIYYYSSTTGDQAGLGYVRAGRGFYRTKISDGETFSMEKTTSDSLTYEFKSI